MEGGTRKEGAGAGELGNKEGENEAMRERELL